MSELNERVKIDSLKEELKCMRTAAKIYKACYEVLLFIESEMDPDDFPREYILDIVLAATKPFRKDYEIDDEWLDGMLNDPNFNCGIPF